MPGNNEVPDNVWKSIRPLVEDQIKSGLIVEVEAKVETKTKKDPKGKETKEVVINAKSFKDMDPEKAEAIIQDTYDIDSLKTWKKKAPESIRILISEQIEKIEKEGTK